MNLAFALAPALGFALVIASMSGCQTGSPGMKDTLGSYSTNVDAPPDKATKAARRAVEEMKLTDIASTGTKIDGVVTARNAKDDKITITVEQAGDNVSKVSVRVGKTGDEAVSKQILDRTRDNLHWF